MPKFKLFPLLILTFTLTLTSASIYSYSKCSSTQNLNTATLKCQPCGTNKIPNPKQPIPNQCICLPGYLTNSNNVCTQYFPGSSSICLSYQFIDAFDRQGNILSPAPSSCSNCDSKAYKNQNGTACTPCNRGMIFNISSNKCQCEDSSWVQSQLGCFPESYTSSIGLTVTSSVYATRLKYLVPGCYHFKDQLSCSQIINLCVYSLASTQTPECNFFTKSNLTSYLYADTIKSFILKTVTKDSNIKMKIISYLPEGNYVKQKDFQLSDIMRCGTPTQTDYSIGVGNNIDVSCVFNFNNVVAQMTANSYQSYVYQMLIQGQNGVYYEVKAYLNSNTGQPVKRFFLQDTFTSKTSIRVLTSMQFKLTLNSDGHLTQPSLYLYYTQLSVQQSIGISPSSSSQQTLTYKFLFSSNLQSFWSTIIPIFIVINILIVLHASGKTYISYLNRRTPFLFFLNLIDVWSFWMFYFLLIITGYWFLFTKTTSTIFIFISVDQGLYVAFYVIFALMVLFRFIYMIIQKNDKLNIQVFMINRDNYQANKDNPKFQNSWREIFIANSLAQFCTYRTFSVFWLMIVMLFFMIGVKWENHAAEVITTNLDNIQYFNAKNKIYLYFLSSSILLTISIVFKILRRLTVLCWPYPIQDFIDYCTVTNISFFFMKKRSPQAYYLHTSMPMHTDVNYKQINQAIKQGLNKNRSIFNEISQNNQKMYILYLSDTLQNKFNTMISNQQNQDNSRNAIHTGVAFRNQNSGSKNSINYREQFAQNYLKSIADYFVSLKNNSNNTSFQFKQSKNFFQSFFHIPPINLRSEESKKTNAILDNKLDLVKEVFPNGDQFEEIHTLIIIYLLWIVVTGSSPIAAFLTYFCDQYLMNSWIRTTYKKNLEKMTKVKQGFMF